MPWFAVSAGDVGRKAGHYFRFTGLQIKLQPQGLQPFLELCHGAEESGTVGGEEEEDVVGVRDERIDAGEVQGGEDGFEAEVEQERRERAALLDARRETLERESRAVRGLLIGWTVESGILTVESGF